MVKTARRNFILVREGFSRPRYRLTVAHEISHFLLHDTTSLQQYSDIESSYASPVKGEREAEEFAVNLLLPESLLVPRIEPNGLTVTGIRSMAADFATTLTTTTAIRCVELSSKPYAVVISDGEKITRYRISTTFPRFPLRIGLPVPPDSSARTVVHKTLLQPMTSQAKWNSRQPHLYRKESMKLGGYGLVLTLTWP